ncbi:MAG: type II secretion system F family protein, partial [Verrucomicrobia bacterium]
KRAETGGVLEVTLRRLAEFMEKAHKIKSKVKGAMFYPLAVFAVALAVMGVLMVYVVPRFQEVFNGLLAGSAMPAFTVFVMRISDAVRHHVPLVGLGVLALAILCAAFVRTSHGRLFFDRLKINAPILGPVFRKASISRFTRTLGTLLGSGVPVLQALSIVKETAGNLVMARVVGNIRDCVKEGETITLPLRESKVIPPLVVGMVDVGEQTGALPDMLLKIADNCDDDVDNAVNAMTSLLEPIMIVFLAIIVGSIVIAMFLPLIVIVNQGFDGNNGKVGDN